MSDAASSSAASQASENEPVVEINYPVGVRTEVPKTDGNVFKTVLVEGKESPRAPRLAKVTVQYTGSLTNPLPDGGTTISDDWQSTAFDSSLNRNEPFTFTLGQGQVIQGWDVAVATMRVNEKAILEIAPSFGYGESGSPPKIPPRSTLFFVIELLEWSKAEDISIKNDGTLWKDIRREGRGHERPDYEGEVEIDLVVSMLLPKEVAAESLAPEGSSVHNSVAAKYNMVPAQDVLINKEWKFKLGEDENLPFGLETALRSMKEEEEAVVTAGPKKIAERLSELKKLVETNQKKDDPESFPEVDKILQELSEKGGGIQYLVTVKKLKPVHPWAAQGEEKIKEGEDRKMQGNAYMSAQKYTKAEAKYRRGLEYVEFDYGLSDEDKKKALPIRLALQNNLAQALLSLGKFKEAIDQCNKILESDSSQLKAFFRRAKANFLLDEWDDAKRDCQLLLEKEPSSVDTQQLLASIRAKQADYDKKQRARYSKMFA